MRICLRTCIVWFALLNITISCNRNSDTNSHNDELRKKYRINLEEAQRITNGNLSLPYSLKAYEIAGQLSESRLIGAACIEISHDYERMGELSEALNFTIKAAKLFEEIKDNDHLAIVYNRIGTIYFMQGDTNLSLKYLNDALRIHKLHEISDQIGSDLNNIGEIYRLQGSMTLAKEYFLEALEYFSSDADSISLAYTEGNLGLVYTNLGQLDSSNYYLERATTKLKAYGDYYPIAVYIAEDAAILFKEKKYARALAQIQRALEISEREGLREQMANANNLLSKIQLQRGKYPEALKAYKRYHSISDSLTNLDVVRKMESQRSDYEIEKREGVITNLKQVNKLRNIITGLLVVGIISAAIFAIFYFRFSNKLKITNKLLSVKGQELEFKNTVIEDALHEKEALLKEIHHRVKNNLQIISSLLSLQSRQLEDGDAIAAIDDSHKRIQTISLLHQKLYQTENLAFVKAKEYIQQLMETIDAAFSSSKLDIEYKLDIDDLNFDVDTAVPLGLIINELAVNAYKYAFRDSKRGRVTIALKQTLDHTYNLEFKDNGVGLPVGFEPDNSTSLGIRLVKILTRQLEGELKVDSKNGARFNLNFADKNYQLIDAS